MLNTKRGQKELIGISTTKIEQRKITPPLQKGVTTLTTTETFKFKEFVKDFNDNVATMNLPNKRNYMRSKSTSRSSRRNTSRGNSIVSKSDSNNNESSDDQRESKLSFKQAALAVLASKKLMKIDTIRRREREISLFAQNSLYGDSELNTNSASNNSGDISDSIVNNTPTKVARNNLSPLNRKNIIMIPNKKAANSEEGQINEKPIAEKKVNRNILKARIFSELIKSRLASGNQMGAKTVEKLPGPTDSGSAENSSSNVLSNNQNDTSKATTLSISRMRAPSTITKGLVGGNRISININAFTSVEEQFKPNSRTPKKSANKGKFSLRSPSSNKRFTGNDSINMSPSRRSSSSPLAAISEVAVKSDNISSSTDMNETVVGSENRISRTSHVISSRLTGSVALKNRTSLIKPNLSNPVRSGKKRNTNIKLTDPLSQNDKTLSKSNSRKNTVGLVSNRSLELITPQDSLISIAEKQSNSLEGSVSSSIGSKSGKASRKRKKFGSKFVDNDDDKYQKIVMSPLSRTGSGTYSVGSDEEETYKDNSKFSLKQESSVDNVDGLDGSSGYKSKGDKKDGKSIRATPKRLTRKIEVQQK